MESHHVPFLVIAYKLSNKNGRDLGKLLFSNGCADFSHPFGSLRFVFHQRLISSIETDFREQVINSLER